MSSSRVQQVMRNLLETKAKKVAKGQQTKDIQKDLDNVAEGFMKEIMAEYSMTTLRFFAWTLHKVFNTIYE